MDYLLFARIRFSREGFCSTGIPHWSCAGSTRNYSTVRQAREMTLGMIKIAICMRDKDSMKRPQINRKRAILRTRPYSSEVPSLSLPIIPLAVVSVDRVIHSLRKILVRLHDLFQKHLLHYHIYMHTYTAFYSYQIGYVFT